MILTTSHANSVTPYTRGTSLLGCTGGLVAWVERSGATGGPATRSGTVFIWPDTIVLGRWTQGADATYTLD